ncbi:MAG: UvrD-helicase domain-containing protein [Dethiobacteria bacterium]
MVIYGIINDKDYLGINKGIDEYMFIADLHIHSKYSRATSRDCAPEVLDLWARRKGISVLGAGDFTHPAWRRELKEKLIPSREGLYKLKDEYQIDDKISGAAFRPHFIVSGEISSIYKKNGKLRKVHNLIVLPSLEDADLIAGRLEAIGNLHSDGRPILGLDSRDLLEIVLDVCPRAIFIPAHIWTPHFSLYGAYSGFDRIEECFEDLTEHIFALETGLSSDPPMNWRLSALDKYALVSNSDAHSPAKLGREANIFDTVLSYEGILDALRNCGSKKFKGTIEFFPEEGKYHFDGHRKCKICWKPAQTIAAKGICPVCGGRITVGVLHRVEELADREEGFVPASARPFESLVPLMEVIAAALGYTTASKKAQDTYLELIRELGPDFYVLREAALSDIRLVAGPCVAEAIRRLRCGKVEILPGFDGEYGKIKIIDKSEIDKISGQLSFFKEGQRKQKRKQDSVPASRQPLMESFFPGQRNEKVGNISVDNPYGLNNKQWEAVSSTSRAISVIAGPGTGKTKTLVSRIAYLVEKGGIDPAHITSVTFTNKAAEEMRLRLEAHFRDKQIVDKMTIGTFHSICLQILSALEGRDNIHLIDEYNALSIIAEIIEDMDLEISAREAKRKISLFKNGVSFGGEVPALIARYEEQLKRFGVMDFDDLLLVVLRQFEERKIEGSSMSKQLESAFKHLLVDEFQDLNAVQYRLLREWGRKSDSIFIIGDPHQSIYGFRGSDFRFFERFKKDFPGMQNIRLTQNYRSTTEIIGSASSVISKVEAVGTNGRLAGSLEAVRGNGMRVRLVEVRGRFSEALFVTKEIGRMVGGIDMLAAHKPVLPVPERKGLERRKLQGFSDIAVLYRTNRQAEILERCLSEEGIPYVVVGRDEFLAEEPVRKTIAFFHFLLNPSNIPSLLICLRAEHLYSTELREKILDHYSASEKGLPALAKIIEEISPLLGQLPDKADKSRKLIELWGKYEGRINKEKPVEIIEAWIKDNNLSEERSMEMLLNTSVTYDDLPSFIHSLVLGRESDIFRSGSKIYTPDAVSLMTIHGSKGLEFSRVFICGVNDGAIPLRNSSSDCDLDEERRLFYVGMTRARDELILINSSDAPPSPFIADIPAEQLTRESAFIPKKEFQQYKQTSLFDYLR